MSANAISDKNQRAIAKRARARLAATPGHHSAILDLAGGNPDLVTSEIVGQAYAAGDSVARDLILETIEVLSVWLGNIASIGLVDFGCVKYSRPESAPRDASPSLSSLWS